MIPNLNKMLIIFFIALAIHFTNGHKCFDGSSSTDCSCVTGVCNCILKTPTNVRQGLSCTIGTYDSVSLQFSYRINLNVNHLAIFLFCSIFLRSFLKNILFDLFISVSVVVI